MSLEKRWKQRFENFQKAYYQLEDAVKKNEYSNLEKAGLIQTYNFTFELSWKVLQDLLKDQGFTDIGTPKKVLRHAFKSEYIIDGEVWIDMLDSRNEMAHTYNQVETDEIIDNIKKIYFNLITELFNLLKEEVNK